MLLHVKWWTMKAESCFELQLAEDVNRNDAVSEMGGDVVVRMQEYLLGFRFV